jgi:Fic family protein
MLVSRSAVALEQFVAAAETSEQTVAHVIRRVRFWVRHGPSPLNDRERKALNFMLDAGPEGMIGSMTNRKHAHLTRTSPATAQRDLVQMVELGYLKLTGAGRSARYDLAEP